MNGEVRFHALRWIQVNSGSISGCEVEEFIDTTRTYSKTVWSDGYTEITEISATHTGEAIKEINKKLVVNKLVTKCVYFC
jgi:hypothetical protein